MPSEILIPEGIDLTKWSCIACDQHTKEKEYFEKLESFVGDAESSYRLVFPEIFLGDDDEKRIESINRTMEEYLQKGLFKTFDGYILTIRKTSSGDRRVGVLLAIDLDDYSFEKGEEALIRSTEETVKERIPARVNIRKNAPLELPHVMLLADDEKCDVIERLDENKERFEKIYDFELSMGGGNVEGYYIPKSENVAEAFMKTQKGGILFAVGDGNHSLAAAKTVWENKKAMGETDSNARYALVEVVNIYSPAIEFKPIHRLLSFVDSHKLIERLKNSLEGNGKLLVFGEFGEIELNCPENAVECYKEVQCEIDKYLSENSGEVDYIHGDDVLKDLSKEKNRVGIIMPTLKKSEIFSSVEKYGSLPRKTFSMGEADDKRFYLELRKIV